MTDVARRSGQTVDVWDGRHTRAAAALGTRVLVEATGLVRHTHRAISGRVFRLGGPPARPVRLVHDAIADIAYTGVQAGAIGAGLAGAAAGRAQSARGRPGRPMSGRLTVGIAAVSGLIGDRLAEAGSPFAVGMTLFDAGGAPVGLSPAGGERVVLFVHGLCESERAWYVHRPAEAPGDYESYLAAAAADGWTPLALRYNTGLPIAENAVRLADLLEDVARAWPVPVRQVALVGHSMGGLVARAAASAAMARQHEWVRRVSHLAYLGSPHAGAPLARAATRGSRLLAKVPEVSAIGAVLEYRSAGIRDLDHGLSPAATRRGVPAPEDVPALLPGARHLAVAGALGRSCESPLAKMVGDLLVTPVSACGGPDAAALGFDPDATHRIARLNHFRLLNDARVESLLRAHLALPRPPAGTSTVDTPAGEA